MHVIFSDVTGAKVEGIVLAVSAVKMRVVVRKLNDTMELRLVDGVWLADDDSPVEIESLISEGAVDAAALSGLGYQTLAARN